jgi:hypothetical protein
LSPAKDGSLNFIHPFARNLLAIFWSVQNGQVPEEIPKSPGHIAHAFLPIVGREMVASLEFNTLCFFL